MRFCPKCSLKIKANIEKCPICKVELLSCADDEEHSTQPPDPKQADQSTSTGSDTPSLEKTVSAPETKPQQPAPPVPASTPAQSVTGNDELAQKIEQLTTQLTSIEKNLALINGKDAVIKKSVVDLEAKINKLEKQVVQQEPFPLDRLEALEQKMDQRTSLTTSTPASELQSPETNPPTRGNIQTLRSLAGKMTPQGFSSDENNFSEEETGFTKDENDDFSPAFQASEITLDEDSSSQVTSERKKKIPLLIPLIALALIAIWLGFYYAKPQNQQIETAIVTEEIAPIPTSPNTEPLSGEEQQPLMTKNDETREVKEVAQPSPEPVEVKPTLTKTPPPAVKTVSDNPPRFTINVGSFKDKKLATALTTRLRDNGYTALMSQSGPNDFYRVKVGAFPTIEEARTYAALLKKKEKLDTFVTSIDQP